jgi:hypothetical protein
MPVPYRINSAAASPDGCGGRGIKLTTKEKFMIL